MLVATSDPVSAVRTALALREGVERELLFPALRTGVHAGCCVQTGGSYFGTPLNLTSRLAAHAEPGQILCTEVIAASVAGIEDVEFRSVRAVPLKNIARPVPLLEISPRPPRADQVVDPVCQLRVDVRSPAASLVHGGLVRHFCSVECAQMFSERAVLRRP